MPERDEDDVDDRPRRRRRDVDEDDDERDAPPRRKKSGGGGIIIALVIGGVLLVVCGGGTAILIGLMLPAVQKVREAAGRAKDSNNLKMVGLAAHSYSDMSNIFSEGAVYRDANTGKTTQNLSFRVHLLPFLEQQMLFQRFNTGEPWDSATNRPLANNFVLGFDSALDPPGTTTTRVRAFVGKGTMYEPGAKVTLSGVQDGTSNTIMLVVADDGVPFSKVDELAYSSTAPVPSIGKKAYPGGTNVLMADGSVRFVKNTISETTLRRLIERNDGMVINDPDW